MSESVEFRGERDGDSGYDLRTTYSARALFDIKKRNDRVEPAVGKLWTDHTRAETYLIIVATKYTITN